MSIQSNSFQAAAALTNPLRQDGYFQDDLTRLRLDALSTLGWITGAISYTCLIFVAWPVTGVHALPISWLGTLVLMLVSGVAILGNRRFQRAARYSFLLGVHFAAAVGMVTLAAQEGAYLFLLPIIFASVLFNRWFVL